VSDIETHQTAWVWVWFFSLMSLLYVYKISHCQITNSTYFVLDYLKYRNMFILADTYKWISEIKKEDLREKNRTHAQTVWVWCMSNCIWDGEQWVRRNFRTEKRSGRSQENHPGNRIRSDSFTWAEHDANWKYAFELVILMSRNKTYSYASNYRLRNRLRSLLENLKRRDTSLLVYIDIQRRDLREKSHTQTQTI